MTAVEQMAFAEPLVCGLHRSWLSQIPDGPLVKALSDLDQSNLYLDRYLCDFFGLEQGIKPESKKLSFLLNFDTAKLLRLMRMAGLVISQEQIRMLVLKSLQKKVIDVAGEDDYEFTLMRGPFLTRKSLVELSPAYTNWGTLDGFAEFIMRTGLRCLALGLSQESENFSQRILLKLPALMSDQMLQDKTFLEPLTQKLCRRSEWLLRKIGKEIEQV